jgi:excisionase family DNA binding protein
MAITVTKMLLPVPDAAASLGVGVTKCWELVATGELPTVRIGRRRLVPLDALEEFARGLKREDAGTTARERAS